MKHYDFAPDYMNVVLAARNEPAPRLPLYEHIVGGRVMADVLGRDPYPRMAQTDAAGREAGFADYWEFWRTMGYDTVSYECCITAILPGGGALGAHVDPVIKNRADFERYPWDKLEDMYFEKFGECFRTLEKTCPAGMKAVGGVGNGMFECVQDLVGFMELCLLSQDDPALYAELFRQMGDLHARIWRRFLRDYSGAYCVLRFGDDLGYNAGTLLPPNDVRTHILPQYRRITDLVHADGRPFLLHSCGNLLSIFDDVIEIANIDAKHSNEDLIAHFSVWAERFGDRIGNFGGIDTDVICRKPAEYIRNYVLDCLGKVSGRGGIAFGSGNSIPDYVPTEGYLAMVETVRDWRGDRTLD